MPKDRHSTIRNRQRASHKQHPSSSKEIPPENHRNSSKPWFAAYLLVLLIIAFSASYFYFYYIYELFENDKHFSHLSTLERELSFRTEMGLYYSYFKAIAVESPTFLRGFRSIISDNRTEAPSTINVLERFNLYPEVLLSFLYRRMKASQMLSEVCYQVNRGEQISPVLSCEGHQEPTYFYVTSVFLLNGCFFGVFFLFGTYFSRSLLGGLITILAYMFNHDEATRVMWTPPLRESFSFPFHIVQLFALTYVLQQQQILTNTEAFKALLGYVKKQDVPTPAEPPENLISPRDKIRLILLLSGSTILYMLPWQFAQFTLATQLFSLGILYMLDLLPFAQFFFIVNTQLISLIVTAVLMFGNRMLLTSLFSITLFSFYLSSCFDYLLLSSSSVRSHRWWMTLRRMLFFALAFVFIKFVLIKYLFSSPDDDAHIWDILKSKLFPSFQTFDTQLYTCAKEFDFLEWETVIKLCRTGLLPLASLIILRLAFDLVGDLLKGNPQDRGAIWKSYHLIQTGAYILIGIMIMRLKLFPVPQLCLLISLFMNEQLWPKRFRFTEQKKWIVFVCIVVGMSVQGRVNIKNQLQIRGEYSNYPMEKMVEWINLNTGNESIFAGTMPTMANLKLSTGRAIVVHPHYEHGKIRRRVKLVYSMFSRKPLRSVHSVLKQYRVDYYVYESHWCTISNRPKGCSFPEMYDLDEEDERILRRSTLACQTLESHPEPYFQKLFHHDYLRIYAVL